MNKKTTTPKTETVEEKPVETTEVKPRKQDVRLVSPFGVGGPQKQLEAIIEQSK